MVCRTDKELTEQWGPKCALCQAVMTGRHLVRSLVPLETARSREYTAVYVVCDECFKKQELI